MYFEILCNSSMRHVIRLKSKVKLSLVALKYS